MQWLSVYQDYLLLIVTTSCLRSLSKNRDNCFSEKETLISTLGKYKQYFCSCLQKPLIMLSAVFEIIIKKSFRGELKCLLQSA